MMGGILLGILASVIQLGIMVGIVVLVVKLVSGRDKTSTDSVGVLIRRFFVYLIMLSMLVLVAIGVAGLIDAALPASGEITEGSAAAARSIAFVIVGLPVYLGLALYTSRRIKADPNEQRSAGWAFYLTVALIGSLVTTMALAGSILSELSTGDGPERAIVIHAAIWAAVWVAHWWVAQRFEPRRNARIHLLLGSAAGLMWTFAGAIATATALLSTIYDSLLLESITKSGVDDLLRPAMILLVGFPVWWWYWLRHARTSQRTSLWLVYTLLLGVLGGVIAAISGAGIMLFSVLQWFLGDASGSAASHFDLLPGAIASLFIGGAAWAYHAHILGQREERTRGEVDRVYDYLLSGAGLAVAAAGVTTLIATALTGMSGRGATATESGDAVAIALTLLVIGVPLWWRYWSTIQRYRHAEATEELQSITRRIYIVGLFGVAAVVAVVSLIVIVFVLVEDILDGTFGASTADDSAIALALLVTAGGLAWYHFAVFREDRTDFEPKINETPVAPELPAVRTVERGSLERTLEALAESGQVRAMVRWREGGYVVEPLDE